MAKKNVWMTWLPRGEGAPEPESTVAALSQVGLNVAGSHWVDDLEKVAWVELGGMLLEPGKHDVWLIVGGKEDFESSRIRYGLSMVAAMLSDSHGGPSVRACVGLGLQPDAASMPSLMSGYQYLSATEPGWSAKVVAAAFGKGGESEEEFRFNVIAHSMLGQWFEVGPRTDPWQGVMFGVDGAASITHHAVGPSGQLPEKAVLEYPSQGIKASLGGKEFVAWSVQNTVGPAESYFVKVEGFPGAVIIGAHPQSDDVEVNYVKLS